MRTFVITGATGFIGGALAKYLLHRGDRVVALVRDGEAPLGCETVQGELEDLRVCERLINEYEPDGVFHLAAQAIVGRAKRDPFATMEANVRGTYNLLEAFRRHRKSTARLVVASSDKAYGELPVGSSEYTEDTPLAGRGPYDCSKSCADLIAQSYGTSYGLPIAIIRAGNVYGEGDLDMSRIVPSLVADVVNGRPLTIMSDGSPIRDYIHVGDVVKGYYTAYEHHTVPDSRAFNLAVGKPISVLELANELLATVRDNAYRGSLMFSKHHELEWYLEKFGGRIDVLGTRTGEIQTQVLGISRAFEELNWKPSNPLRWGLKSTLEWGYNNLYGR